MAIKPIEILINAKDQASSVFDGLSAKIGAVGVAIAGYFGVKAFTGVVKGAADLEQGMSRVQAATGASAEEMAQLRKAAEEAGASTKFTSTEAAGALENLAKAGLSATDSIAALPAVLNLAQAGDIGLGEASEFVTKAVMGMGLAFTDSARVADVLAQGANATNTSVTGLAQALSYAAPVASSLGLSLESTVAIIGKFADAGIDASRAGTALNSILSQFSNPASKFREELGAAGITTNNFETALHQLAASGPAGAKAINAVGQEAGPALRALLNQGMGSLDDLKAKLDGAAGSAAATAKVMQDNLNGSLNGLSSAWDTVKNALGTPVLPVLKDGVDQLAAAFKSAVADGTIAKFGESIAIAFQAGIKWSREFVGQINLTQVMADLRAFADRAGETFAKVGEYAKTAGNSAQFAYGVMSAGANGVLAAIYLLGKGFASVASRIQEKIALIQEGLSKITFGDMSRNFEAAAEKMRLSAQATHAVHLAFADKASEAFNDMAAGAETARKGWAGLAAPVTAATEAVSKSDAEVAALAQSIEDATKKTQAAQKVVQDKTAADAAAAQAVRVLKEEYSALVAAGSLQAAAEKLKQINQALRDTPGAAKDSAKAAQDAAQAVEDAFTRMGITSSAALKQQAEAARRDYEIIRGAANTTAEDAAAAFKKAADAAIAANKGVAPSWVEAQAGANGYELAADKAGKTAVRSMKEAATAITGTVSATNQATAATDTYTAALERRNAAVGKLPAAGRLAANGEQLGEGVTEVGSGGQYQNRQGMWSDAKGNTQGMASDVSTLTGIAAFLKAAGVDDDKRARQIAKEFANEKGEVQYINNPGQIKYGGRSSTMTQALLKAAEKYTFSDANVGSSTIPKPAPPTSVVNITLDGVTHSIKTDADGSDTLQLLLRQLAQAKTTSR